MRYAALVSCCDRADFGSHRILTDAQRKIFYRMPDDLLFALAEYLFSLEPPPNPNTGDPRAAAGRGVFQREGCASCHAPPLYTNNKLTPAQGYQPPSDHPNRADVMSVSVGTDPNLALKTRKGTGFYKVPSLKGVWYRGMFNHDGSVTTLGGMVRSRSSASGLRAVRLHRLQSDPARRPGSRVWLAADRGRQGRVDCLPQDLVTGEGPRRNLHHFKATTPITPPMTANDR